MQGQNFQQVALRLHPAGTLYLTLGYQNLQETFDRARRSRASIAAAAAGTPSGSLSGLLGSAASAVVAPNKLFGVDLETVLEREAAAVAAATGVLTPSPALPQVPLIVKRCVEEVERRGLDIIGIYRLCGADSKKRMLRMAFEDAPEIVDLSSANVPDINVVTGEIPFVPLTDFVCLTPFPTFEPGLLKEYLRELPQPLVSSCLYQMLVDAMGVFLPDDPDGNAKLVFSILDCLPKANRVRCNFETITAIFLSDNFFPQNCLVYVMDHLSKVTSQSARNKMNPHNLSVCFAPVLMLDYSAGGGSAAAAARAAAVDAVTGAGGGTGAGEVTNISEPIQILQYLIEIWPKGQD